MADEDLQQALSARSQQRQAQPPVKDTSQQSPDADLENALLNRALQRRREKRQIDQSPAPAFAGGVNQALIDIIGFPVDIVNKGLGLIGLDTDKPFLGGEQVTGLAREAGFVKGEGLPETGAERAGRVLGSALPGFGAIGTAARVAAPAKGMLSPLIARATPSGAQFKPGLQIAESFARAPRATSIIEGVSVGGAAIGGEVGRQIAEDSPEIGQLVGEIVGGIAAPTSLAVASKLPMIRLADRITQPLRPKGQKKLAGEILEEATGDRQLTLAKKPQFEPLPGTKFTLAEKIDDQNLITLEQAVASKIPSLADDMVRNKAETNKVISSALKNFTGPAPGIDTKDRTLQTFQSVSQRLKNAMKMRMVGAVKKAEDKVRGLQAKNERADISRIMNDEIEDALSDARGQERVLWNSLDENTEVTLRHAKEVMDDFVDEQTPIPNFVRNFLDFEDVKAERFKNVKEFRTKLLRLQTEARAGGRADVAFFLGRINRGILDDITNSSLSDDFGLAVNFSRELNDRFTRGRVGQALRFAPRGGRAIPETQISEELFPQNPVRASQGFEAALKATGPVPGGLDQTNRQRRMTAAVEDLLKTRLFKTDGEFNESAAKNILKTKGEFLSNFPELRTQIQQAVTDINARDKLIGQLKSARSNLNDKNKTALSLITNSRSDVFMKKLLTSPNRKRLLSQAVRTSKKEDPLAFRGLQDAYIDELFKHGVTGETSKLGDQFISGKRLNEFFTGTIKDAASSGLFDKPQLGRLKNIIDNAKRLERVGTDEKRIAAALEDKQNFLQDFIVRVMGAKLGGRVSGAGIGSGLVAAEAGSRLSRKIAEALPQESLIQLLGQAVKDEKLYKELLSIDTSKALARKDLQRIHAWLMGLGIEMVIDKSQIDKTGKLPPEAPPQPSGLMAAENPEFQGMTIPINTTGQEQ